jgi:hypothetical protein
MKLKEVVRRTWRNLELLACALEYDEQTDLRRRLERLEEQMAELELLTQRHYSTQSRHEQSPSSPVSSTIC